MKTKDVHASRFLAGKLLLGAILTSAAIALSSCATTQPANPESSPSPNALANAIEATASRGTTKIAVEVVSDTETLAGTGSASLTSGTGQIDWTNLVTGEEYTELNNKDGLYSQIDGTWFLAPPGTVTPTSGAIAPLSELIELKITSEGSLVGQLPLTIENGLNLSEEDLVSIPAECPLFIDTQITLNESGLITEISKEFPCPGYQRVSTTMLSEFGTSLDLAEPVDPIEVPGNQ